MCLVALDIAERSLRFRIGKTPFGHMIIRFAQMIIRFAHIAPACRGRIGTARDFCRFDQLPFREGCRLSRPRGREERFFASLAEDGQVSRLREQRKRLGPLERDDPSLEGQGDGTDLLRQEDPPSVFRPSDGQHGPRRLSISFF